MGKEVYCSSSRALCAQLAGAARRSRTTRSWHQLPGNGSSVVYVREAPTRSWQELCAGDGSSVLYVRESQYALGRPARAQQRSVLVQAGRVYGCGVLARGQKTIYADAGRVHVHVKTESYRHRYKLEARRKKGR
jgi:hypothetical protein